MIAAALCGCQTVPEIRAAWPVRGLVWVFPGVGGGTLTISQACQGLRDGGVDAEMRIMQWDRPLLDILGQLTDHEANRAQAADVARQIAAYRRQRPGAPVDLVGYSAGGGLALLVAEALPEGVHVRNVVLAQPAVSPTYNLVRALRHIDGQLVSFYSPHDWLILGAGTETFGTVDRRHVASAGKDGFDLPVAVPDETLRAKLVQVRWTPQMIWSGHIGNHVSILGYQWNKDYVAPQLLGARPPAATQPAAARDPPRAHRPRGAEQTPRAHRPDVRSSGAGARAPGLEFCREFAAEVARREYAADDRAIDRVASVGVGGRLWCAL